MSVIKWGIIGIGNIAEKFTQDLATVAGCELYAVASTNLERAQEFAVKHNAGFAFGSYEEIFNAPGLDVVYIATPHVTHAYCTKLCLEKKVAVLCEKPFAMNETEVDSMVKSAKDNDTFLMEAMWTRFLPTTLKTLELVESGAIGEIKTIHADFGFKADFIPERRLFNPKLGGGALLDIGIYPAYLSLLLLGYPSDIEALSIIGSTGVDETTSFVFRYDQNATAVLNCTILANTNTEAWIYGTKGKIQIHSRFHEGKKVTLFKDDETPVDFEFKRETRGYDFEISEVNRCLNEDLKESPLMPHTMSRKLIHLLDKIRAKAGIK
ncbi:MAG: Gfo/Idh/MocA family oxidoreductase [Spirosomaceae bacterium]|nr:Gfo/Idh/MocA family oxidoreductase [Spirosomataceae bacterium]